MARKTKSKIKIKAEKLPKDEQLSDEELKKVTGGGGTKHPGTATPDIDCWAPQK